MSHRTVKKTVYATGFCIVVLGVLFAIALPFFRNTDEGGQLTDAGPSYVPIVLEQVVAIPHIEKPGPKGKTVDIVARLRNENARAGTGVYPVIFALKDKAGAIVQQIKEDVYVLPGGSQYLVALDVPIPPDKGLGGVEVTPPTSVNLIPLPDNARLPDFSVFLRNRTQRTVGSYQLEQQTGVVTNNSTFDWEKVEVTGVALDASGAIVGVGKTFVGKLLIGEQREFTLQWPVPDVSTTRVVALATTNIYSDENIVHIIGDPSTLR